MTDRNCKTCACYAEVTLSPMAPAQSQCRRNGPIPAQVRIERPRMLDGKPVIGKDKKPVTEVSVENVFLYAPTRPDMVCFDGWRPLNAKPGEHAPWFMPERCDFGGDYGQCVLDRGHDGRHDIPKRKD